MENKAYQSHFFAFIEICFMSNSLIKKLDLVVLELKILFASLAFQSSLPWSQQLRMVGSWAHLSLNNGLFWFVSLNGVCICVLFLIFFSIEYLDYHGPDKVLDK